MWENTLDLSGLVKIVEAQMSSTHEIGNEKPKILWAEKCCSR